MGIGIDMADSYTPFIGHGAGDSDSYVFGDECDDIAGAGRAVVAKVSSFLGLGEDPLGLKEHHDPHPNDDGAEAISDAIVATYNAW